MAIIHFYALLSNTPYKWLNLRELFSQVILPIEPTSDLAPLKYFTAPVLGSMASDPRAEQRQACYHRALKAAGGVEIIKGFHTKHITTGILLDLPTDHPVQSKRRVQVMEEKQTDVNIALHIYRDACCRACDQIVLCSNDSDLEPALEMVRSDFPDIKIGLILPRASEKPDARRSGSLERHAHWKRGSISAPELMTSQFPERLLDHRKRTIKKPNEW